MKKCRRCSKPATLHITEIHDGDAAAIHLCESCAREYLEEDDSEETAADPASELAAKLEALVSEGDDDTQTKCSNCDITFKQFREEGRLGCPCCYEEFRTELDPLLENIHEEVVHVGKRPKSGPAAVNEQSRLIQLRNRQREAIEREDYEVAAELRDEIAGIESNLRDRTEGDG